MPDNLKNLGFHYATRASVTLGVQDVTTPADKPKILHMYKGRANKIEARYKKEIITDDERRQEPTQARQSRGPAEAIHHVLGQGRGPRPICGVSFPVSVLPTDL